MKNTRGIVAVLLLMVLIMRAHLSGIAYPFAQGLLLIPALVGLALLLLSPAGDAGQGRRWKEWTIILPWVLCIWSFAGILWSADPGRGLEESFALLLNVVVFTLVYILWRRGQPGERYCIIGLWILLIPVIIRGVYQYNIGLDRLRNLLLDMDAGGQDVVSLMRIVSDNRIFAGFLNPNMMAGFLAIFIPVTLDFTLTSRTRKGQLALGSLVAGQFWVLLLTGSVGGSLAAAGASGAVLLMRRGIRRRDLFWMGSVGIVILVGLGMMRGFDLSVGPDHSVVQRFGYMRSGVSMALERPFVGWGSGSGPGALMGFVTEGIRPVTDPHNFLVRSWISWGIPGLAILITFLLVWAKKVFISLPGKNREGVSEGRFGFAAGGFAFLFHSLMDMDFFVPETAMFGWAALGVCLVFALDPERKDTGPPALPSPPGLKVLGGIVLTLVLPTLVYMQSEVTGFRATRDLEAGRVLQSADRFQEARRLLPFHGRFALEEGRSRRVAGQLEAAVHLFERASELMSHSPYPSWEMGRVALELEEWEASIVHLDRALARYPTSPRIRLDLAQAHYQLSQYEETKELLQEVARYAIFDPEAMAAARKALEVPDPQTDQEPKQTY